MQPINLDDIKIEDGWKQALKGEFTKPYFAQIKAKFLADKQAGQVIYPPGSLIFNAFNTTPFDKVKIVILGQDPYHKQGQAMGLSFSVPQGIAIPPSLRNIYKELQRSIKGFNIPPHGDLTPWAKQGVFLLNAVLSVRQGQAASHAKLGWQEFTHGVIRTLSEQKEGLIFMLWGNFAKEKAALIDATKHHILTAVHPSPLAGGAFIGCNHFAMANEILARSQQQSIDWQN
ncbi:MAG: uracil-DNA glycosylase [Alphaproteobacteria bacterium]